MVGKTCQCVVAFKSRGKDCNYCVCVWVCVLPNIDNFCDLRGPRGILVDFLQTGFLIDKAAASFQSGSFLINQAAA